MRLAFPSRSAFLCLFTALLAGGFPAPVSAGVEQLRSVSEAFRRAVERIRPSVVTVKTSFPPSAGRPRPPTDLLDPRGRQTGEGTGVIFDAKGHVVTSYHVVEGADEIRVTLDDLREFKATLVGKDSKTDLALVRIEAEKLVSADLGDSDGVQVGDWALAVGNAMGFRQTVTLGIISAKGRTGLRTEEGVYEDFLQTDAAINHGNSGGPLCDVEGKVIGINAMIASVSGGSQGLGFAIPINMVKSVVDQLRESGRVRRGYLGVRIDNLSPSLAGQLGFAGLEGAVVQDVQEGGPAGAAGLKVGDIITALEGRPVRDSLDLRNRVALQKPGAQVKIDVARGQLRPSFQVKIGILEDGTEEDEERFGLRLSIPSAAELKALHAEQGVLVAWVAVDSPGAGELEEGTLITSVDRKPVRDPREFFDKLKASLAEDDAEALLYVKTSDGGFFSVFSQPQGKP